MLRKKPSDCLGTVKVSIRNVDCPLLGHLPVAMVGLACARLAVEGDPSLRCRHCESVAATGAQMARTRKALA